jgi:hypothetical protein
MGPPYPAQVIFVLVSVPELIKKEIFRIPEPKNSEKERMDIIATKNKCGPKKSKKVTTIFVKYVETLRKKFMPTIFYPGVSTLNFVLI